MTEEKVRRAARLLSAEALLAEAHTELDNLVNELQVVVDECEICTVCETN